MISNFQREEINQEIQCPIQSCDIFLGPIVDCYEKHATDYGVQNKQIRSGVV